MNPERWKRIDALLQAAQEKPPAERSEFLRQACAGDAALEQEVRSLVIAGERAGSFLESPALEMETREMAQTRLIGQTVSHYRVLEHLGAGGMGVVYKAYDVKLDRLAALKFLPHHLRDNPELKQRLSEEARAASTLDHPNIVVIYDIDETPAGDLFIAMAYHEGVTLRDRIEQAKPAGLPIAEALEIARQVAAGLSRAHERGIFHRDIKPSNIIVAKDGVARIIDFGLAKSTQATATMDGSTKGTPLYMSPEQASGKPLDNRTDLWSLGAVLYEMLGGRPPFSGESHLSIMHNIVHDAPPNLRQLRPDLPPAVARIVGRAMEKDLARRYQSAGEMALDLSKALSALGAPSRRRSVALAPVLALIVLAAGVAFWLNRRSENRHWAREQGIPQIARLMREKKPVAAYLVSRRVSEYIAGDPQLAQAMEGITHAAAVKSTPPGALVEVKDYLSPGDAWFALGTTPLTNIPLPTGYLRWRLTKPGYEEFLGAPIAEDIHGPISEFNFLLEPSGGPPKGMVSVPAQTFDALVWSIGEVGPYDLPKYYIDRFEVTNAQYQEFVDQGGYQKRGYWKQKFVREGKELRWEEAIDIFRDATGRFGPATWAAGHYPAGQGDLPVGGVSWFEAEAYAEFAGKSLPTLGQWLLAAPSPVARYIVQVSNFALTAPASGGKYQGLGPWGTYDMAGNMAEWCWNEGGKGSRYIMGGAWNTSSSDYWEPDQITPWNRLPNAGLRCVRNTASAPPAASSEVVFPIRDFTKAKPAPDSVFAVYKTLYAYDPTPLHEKSEPVTQDSPDWRKEKIVIDAAYGNERMPIYLFLPAKVKPPYQTVVFFPSARVLGIPSSNTLGDMKFIDYVIQSGRAVAYPVYKGTYERPSPDNTPTTATGREVTIQESKDVRRVIDYLVSRPDIDRTKIGYMGVSMGAALGVIYTALEERFKAVIFLDGGFFAEKLLPGTDQADFAPRLKAPVLMICGKYDWIFLGKEPLMKMFGAPEADKQVQLLDTAHDVSEQRPEMMHYVLAFLDKYLGKIN